MVAGYSMAVRFRKAMGSRIVMKRFVVQDAAGAQGKTFLELPLTKADPGRIMQASDHESPIVDTHPLDRSLILVSRMIIRHAIRIDGRAIEKRGKIGTGDIRPDKFIEQDDADAERLNLGYRRFEIVPGTKSDRRDRARDCRGLARLGSIRPTVGRSHHGRPVDGLWSANR